MKRIAWVVLLPLQLFAAQTLIVGYFPNWSMYNTPAYTFRDVPYSKVTHICYAFFIPAANGSVQSSDAAADAQQMDSLVARAHAAGVKVLVSVGGATGSAAFPALAASAPARGAFGHALRQLLAAHNLDGVDLDWEFPALADTANLRILAGQIRDTLDAIGPGRLLTLAVSASDWNGKYIRAERFLADIDWLGVMTYDFTGDWIAKTWHNAAMVSDGDPNNWSVTQSMAYWVGRGVPKAKLLTGTPFYGRTFAGATGPNSTFTGVGSGSGMLNYNQITPKIASGFYQVHWDTAAQVPWGLSSGGEYVSYDDPRSVAIKGRWLRSQGYAGTIIWELSGDLKAGNGYLLLDSLTNNLAVAAVRQSDGRNPGGVRTHEAKIRLALNRRGHVRINGAYTINGRQFR